MTSPAHATSQPTAESPPERLTRLLKDDMVQVNALILKRMEATGVPLIPQLAGYLIAAGGKRVRPLLTIAAARMYGDTGSRSHLLATAVEFIHTATLLHDDVVDESDERRGQPAANTIFGNQSSVLVGDFLFSRAFQLMVEDGSLDVLRILSNASAVIAQGEVQQLSIARDTAATMEDYLSVINAKTAELFAAACEIGPIIAGRPDAADAMRRYGTALGMAFQIVDDVLDYTADPVKLGKAVGDDFRDGKMTAPVLMALASATPDEKAFWDRAFVERNVSDADLATAQTILARHNAFARAMDMAAAWADQARGALQDAPQGPLRDTLHDLLGFVLSRDH